MAGQRCLKPVSRSPQGLGSSSTRLPTLNSHESAHRNRHQRSHPTPPEPAAVAGGSLARAEAPTPAQELLCWLLTSLGGASSRCGRVLAVHVAKPPLTAGSRIRVCLVPRSLPFWPL